MIKSTSKDKIMVEVEIFNLWRPANQHITWKDIKHLHFEDDDIIRAEYVEEFYSENESWDAHHSCTVTRQRLENDDEYSDRRDEIERERNLLKVRRYENYLRLKLEFENQ